MGGNKDELRAEMIAMDASRWVTRLEQGGLDAVAEFREWLLEEPAHCLEFLEMIWLDFELARLPRSTRLEVLELMRKAREAASAAGGSQGSGDRTH